MDTLIQIFLSPIRTFLEEQGLWDNVIRLYHKVAELINTIGGWFGVEASSDSNIWGFVLGFFKLVFNIIITVVNVFIDIISWILNLL